MSKNKYKNNNSQQPKPQNAPSFAGGNAPVKHNNAEKIRNLDQVRAKNAFDECNGKIFSNADGGNVAKKIPEMIRNNGFLGALAFAWEKHEKFIKQQKKQEQRGECHEQSNNKGDGYYEVFEAILKHLKSPEIAKTNETDPKALFDWLAGEDSDVLRDITAESLLYLNFFRRFAKNKDDSEKN